MYRFIANIAPYEDGLLDFLRLRLINKGCDTIIQNTFFKLMEDNTLHTRKTFVPIGKCWDCSAVGEDVEQRICMMDDPPRRVIVSCDRWKCRLNTLFSKMKEIYLYDKFVYFYPKMKDRSYHIPRTDPTTVTMGKLVKNFYDVVVFRREQFCVYVEWIENNQAYRKLVPVKRFAEKNNITETFKIRPEYAKLNVLCGDLKNNII